MSLEKAISDTQREVRDCLAVGLVDMSTGMLLAVKTVDSHPQEVLDLVAAATSDLYRGPNVTAIEDAFKRRRGVTDDKHYFQDVIVISDNLLHVFLRSKRNTTVVMVTVCRKSANLGMALSKSRMHLTKVEAFL